MQLERTMQSLASEGKHVGDHPAGVCTQQSTITHIVFRYKTAALFQNLDKYSILGPSNPLC